MIDLIRGDVSLRWQLEAAVIEAGDRLVVRSRVGDMLGLRQAGDVAFGGAAGHAIEPIDTRETVLMEGVVGPQSRFAGRLVADLNLRRLYGAYILAIHRQGANVGGNFDQVRLQMGDTVLLEGPPQSMRQLFDYQEMINLVEPSEKPLRRTKAPIAVGAVLAVMGLAAFDVLPIAGLALMAAVAVVAFGCLEAEEAYRSIRWNILMLIFGMLALGVAMQNTGAAKLIVDGLAMLVAGMGPVAVLSALYLATSLLTELMSNNATAILLTRLRSAWRTSLGWIRGPSWWRSCSPPAPASPRRSAIRPTPSSTMPAATASSTS